MVAMGEFVPVGARAASCPVPGLRSAKDQQSVNARYGAAKAGRPLRAIRCVRS
jgi:hypothetical protein